MSIIHDALKKVQQMNNAAAPTPPAASQEPVQAPEQTKMAEKINIPLLVAAACAVIAMIFAVLPQLKPGKTTLPPASATTAPTAPAAEQKQPAPIAVTPTPSLPPPIATSLDSVSKAVTNAVAASSAPAQLPATKITDPNDPLSSIQIEGVLDMGGKKAVLINGNVYEEGQTIYGKIISEITFDTVTIMEDGRKRTFPIKP